jgi:nucleoside 2-deoxyribosyltransferase
MKIYLGCSMTGAPESFNKEVISLYNKLNSKFEVLPFFNLVIDRVPNSNSELFEFDINQINKSDFMIAICTYPSTGMGYEISHALNTGKKVFAFAKKEDRVSKFVDGGITHPNYKFSRVESFEDIANFTF